MPHDSMRIFSEKVMFLEISTSSDRPVPLNKDQSKFVMSSINKSDDKNVSFRTKTMINLVMDPLKSYFNPLEHILEDCEVDNGLEHLFSLESMGIKKDDKELISFDEDQISRFREGISF